MIPTTSPSCSFHATQIKGNVEIKSSANGGCDAKLTYTATCRSP
jgi:hypothetical protein